jgi:hypothetical protein
MSAGGVVLSGTLMIALLHGAPPLPWWLAGSFVSVSDVLVFPPFAAALAASALAGGRRIGMWTWLARLPVWAWFVFGALFVGFWLGGSRAYEDPRGITEISNGQYALDNHDSISVVDRATYDRVLTGEQLTDLRTAGSFGVVATAMLAGYFATRPKSGRSQTTADGTS